jgi:hypothetical protein
MDHGHDDEPPEQARAGLNSPGHFATKAFELATQNVLTIMSDNEAGEHSESHVNESRSSSMPRANEKHGRESKVKKERLVE